LRKGKARAASNSAYMNLERYSHYALRTTQYEKYPGDDLLSPFVSSFYFRLFNFNFCFDYLATIGCTDSAS